MPHLCQSRRGLRAPRFIICWVAGVKPWGVRVVKLPVVGKQENQNQPPWVDIMHSSFTGP